MISSALTTALLAGQTLLGAGNLGAASRRAGRGNTGEALIWLGVVVGGIIVVCVATRYVSRLQRQRRANHHGLLFKGLCQTHGLDHRARSLLRQVARSYRLPQPARLFTEPKWLDPANLRGALRRRTGEVISLRDQFFAEAATAEQRIA